MRRIAAVFAAAVVVAVVPAPGAGALPEGTKVSLWKDALSFPVDLAWARGTNKLFFTEKNTGRIRVMVGRRLLRRPCVDLDVESAGESGAMGLALHPRFARNRKLYVFFTNDSPRENRVRRFVVRRNRCRRGRTIVAGLPASTGYHNGGQLEFVGGKLFVSVGENHDPSAAQDRSRRIGKVLRLNPDGTVPSGNPFSSPGDRNPVWSYGHRNPFGLAHEPGTRRLYETENGPSCDDELNRIVRGRNYGWGDGYDCGTAGVGPNPKRPLKRWSDVIVPTDPWFYEGRMRRLSGDLYVGDFSAGKLRRVHLNRKGTRVRRIHSIHDASEGIVDVTKGPGGWLYFATPSSIRRIVPE